MLVLERKNGERIELSNGVSIVVITRGRQIRIGVKAPDGVKILRGELVDKLIGDDETASHQPPAPSHQTLSATPAETTVT